MVWMFFFFKQKTAYEMRISDWSSDVCSSDLAAGIQIGGADDDIAEWAKEETPLFGARDTADDASDWLRVSSYAIYGAAGLAAPAPEDAWLATKAKGFAVGGGALLATWGATEGLKRSEEHTSERQSLMRI